MKTSGIHEAEGQLIFNIGGKDVYFISFNTCGDIVEGNFI